MGSRLTRILLVEDNPGDARLLQELLREAGWFDIELTHCERLEPAREQIVREGADAVLLDLSLPDAQGMETVTRMLKSAPTTPIIVLTDLDDEQIALEAVKAGAQDYLIKGQVTAPLLVHAIRYAQERKHLEIEREQLLQREREARTTAEEAVLGRDEVLRVVAHDLGSSISAIRMTAETLLLHTLPLPQGEADAKARQQVENIRKLAEQMQRLRQDLLDVARLDAGQLSLDTKPLAPKQLVQILLERYGDVAAGQSIELETQVSKKLPTVQGDSSRLLQVMTNLLGNSIKFTPPGGKVVVGAERSNGDVSFFVRDNGTGIPAADMPRLFDRFWTSKGENPDGAGLGLAIAKGIVEAHGGQIWAESQPGEGSTFRFVLPGQ